MELVIGFKSIIQSDNTLDQTSKPMPHNNVAGSGTHRLIVRRIAVLVVLSLVVILVVASCILGDNPIWIYRMRRGALEAVVNRAGNYPVQVGSSVSLEVSPRLDPATLMPRDGKVETDSYYRVTVYRIGLKDNVIEIVTSDRGHAGMSGLVYSDSIVHPTTNSQIGGTFWLRFTESQLSPHWFYCFNNQF